MSNAESELEPDINTYLAQKTDEQLQEELTMLATAKFNPPYFDENTRKIIDEQIFAVWKETQRRK